jgi:hypothetical protein
VTAADIGATGAACVVPDAAERTSPATAIANTVRNMCLSLFLWRFAPCPHSIGLVIYRRMSAFDEHIQLPSQLLSLLVDVTEFVAL